MSIAQERSCVLMLSKRGKGSVGEGEAGKKEAGKKGTCGKKVLVA